MEVVPLNGIISLTEREPGTKGEFRAKIQGGIYDNPKRSTLQWWSKGQKPYVCFRRCILRKDVQEIWIHCFC